MYMHIQSMFDMRTRTYIATIVQSDEISACFLPWCAYCTCPVTDVLYEIYKAVPVKKRPA